MHQLVRVRQGVRFVTLRKSGPRTYGNPGPEGQGGRDAPAHFVGEVLLPLDALSTWRTKVAVRRNMELQAHRAQPER